MPAHAWTWLSSSVGITALILSTKRRFEHHRGGNSCYFLNLQDLCIYAIVNLLQEDRKLALKYPTQDLSPPCAQIRILYRTDGQKELISLTLLIQAHQSSNDCLHTAEAPVLAAAQPLRLDGSEASLSGRRSGGVL